MRGCRVEFGLCIGGGLHGGGVGVGVLVDLCEERVVGCVVGHGAKMLTGDAGGAGEEEGTEGCVEKSGALGRIGGRVK